MAIASDRRSDEFRENGTGGAGRSARRSIKGLRSLGPFAVSLTVYGLLLDHLPEEWFGFALLRYVFSLLLAIGLGLGLRHLLDLATGERLSVVPAPVAAVTPARREESVRALFDETARRLVADMRRQTHGGVTSIGWSQFIGDDRRPSPIGSSYGLRIALLLDLRSSLVNKAEIVESVLKLQKPGGGWAASTGRDVARPEVTAWVLQGLARAGVDEQTRLGLVALLEDLVREPDQITVRHTTIVATLVAALLELSPSSEALPSLLRRLVEGASRSSDGRYVSWGTTLNGADRASTPHTARAVVVLKRARTLLPNLDSDLPGLIEGAVSWLCRPETGLAPDTEQVRRSAADGAVDVLVICHFTAAWVARALADEDGDAARPQILAAIEAVLEPHRNGTWSWRDGSRPMWMTYQGLVALREHVLRAAPLER